MPIVTVSMYSGRTQREKDRLSEAMTEDIAMILNIKKEEVIIVVLSLKLVLSVLNLVVFLSFIFISSFDDILRDKLPKYIKEVKDIHA